MYPTEGDSHIKAYCEGMVNFSLCKIASVVLSIYVMEINIIICINNEITIKNHEKSNNWLMRDLFIDMYQASPFAEN